jgi:hypothetical protein
MNSRRKILLAFNSWWGNGLLREIIAQLDRSARIDYVADEQDLVSYIGRHSVNWLPDLIIFDSPPVHRDTAGLVTMIRDQRAWKIIPIALFLAPHDIPTMARWLRGKGVYFYPQGGKPSDCKYYLRQILQLAEVV